MSSIEMNTMELPSLPYNAHTCDSYFSTLKLHVYFVLIFIGSFLLPASAIFLLDLSSAKLAGCVLFQITENKRRGKTKEVAWPITYEDT